MPSHLANESRGEAAGIAAKIHTSMAMEGSNQQQEKRHRSIFDLPTTFLDSCRLLPSPSSLSSYSGNPIPEKKTASSNSTLETLDDFHKIEHSGNTSLSRWTCNTCKSEFDSLEEQRSHFKLDVHRFNVKLSIAGKGIVKEEDFDEISADSLFKDYDISSISGSEDEVERGSWAHNDMCKGSDVNVKQKLFIQLETGEKVSVWKCLVLDESENILYENDLSCSMPCVKENDVIEKLKFVINEPRDKTHLRVVLLASGGHFAGCVFDGSSVVAHKTFHRYVVRAKAGKKQSSKDASGRAAHSAGASLRRYNELALKKDIQELLASWKPYFEASSCIFIYAPSNNRQLLFNGEKAYFSNQTAARNVPLTVRRPTFKEALRIYNQLTQVSYDMDGTQSPANIKDDLLLRLSRISIDSPESFKVGTKDDLERREDNEACSSNKKSDDPLISSETELEFVGSSTPLHEAAKCGDCDKVLELLEEGLDPCDKDERGKTPYMLATEKEVRNTFRRFMASNLDKWDWHAAKVPSALTKEMEESQAAKQADKDAKRKARSKELKKLRKAKEKNSQTQAASSQNSSTVSHNQGTNLISVLKGQPGSSGIAISREEELKRAAAAEREKRAAAAERRIAAAALLNAQGPSSSQPKSGMSTDINCSYCYSSLDGKIPFHRYNYKYCSTTCMHVHREILEDA